MTEPINTAGYENKGNYINAAKVESRKELQVGLIVTDVRNETLKDVPKIALVMGGIPETFVLNQTNYKIMKEAKGADPKKWITATITLGLMPALYEGKMVKSVVIVKVV